jgi:hypothetical protein
MLGEGKGPCGRCVPLRWVLPATATAVAHQTYRVIVCAGAWLAMVASTGAAFT